MLTKIFLSFPLSFSILLLSHLRLAQERSCAVFDINWNLYAFGINGADFNLSDSSNWNNGKAQQLPTQGRPPFDGGNTQCFLAEYFNVIYVLDGDNSNPGDVHIFNVQSQNWTTQKTSLSGADPSSFISILDHDTNVFYALSNSSLYSLDFGKITTAGSNTLDWQNTGSPSFQVSGYNPVMALAQNHIFFLDVPGASAGNAYIFVIHFNYFQPSPQPFNPTSGDKFPASHGTATSFFQNDGVQQLIAFIPDDGSATYVLNVETNTTVQLAGPSVKDSKAYYAASTSALVQLSSNSLYYIPYDQSHADTTAKWSAIHVSGLPTNNSTTTTSSTSGPTTGTGKNSATSTGSQSPSSTSSKPNGSVSQVSGASGMWGWAMSSLGCLAIGALLL